MDNLVKAYDAFHRNCIQAMCKAGWIGSEFIGSDGDEIDRGLEIVIRRLHESLVKASRLSTSSDKESFREAVIEAWKLAKRNTLTMHGGAVRPEFGKSIAEAANALEPHLQTK